MILLSAVLFGNVIGDEIVCAIGEHEYKGECIMDNPCPSDECWRYDTSLGECVLREEAVAQCSAILCNADSIKIQFSSALLGLKDGEKEPFGVWDETKPKWSMENEQWEYFCLLGGCDMTTYTKNKQLVFYFRWELPGEQSFTGDFLINSRPLKAIEYECVYDKRISITSEPVQISRSSKNAIFRGHGDITQAFTMTLHSDDSFMGESERVHLGDPLFVRVEWHNQAVNRTVRFFVEQCVVNQGPNKITIVKGNCYAQAVGAKFLSGDHHLVSHISDWVFSTFTSDQDDEKTGQTIDCALQFCVAGEYCPINSVTKNCPNSMPVDYYFGFTTFGQSEK